MSSQKKLHSEEKGFTLIEMIVVIALISILTTVILFNSGRLNSAVLVSNAAYEMGLIVRESQVAGLGVRAVNSGATQTLAAFTSSHGVHFNMSTPTKVILFGDLNKNGAYDVGEMTQEYNIQNKRSGTILAICAKVNPLASGPCTTTTTSYTTAATADIVFSRPNPEAFFKIRTSPGGSIATHSGAIIVNVGFSNDVCRSVIIEKTGAVQVDSSFCPPIQ